MNEPYEHVDTIDVEIHNNEIIIKPRYKCHHIVEIVLFIIMFAMLILIGGVLLFNWFMCLTCPSGCLQIV